MKLALLIIALSLLLVEGGNLYAVIENQDTMDFGILDITTAKLNKICSLPVNCVLPSTDSRVMVPTSDGAIHMGIFDLGSGVNYIYTVDIDNGTQDVNPLPDIECPWWQWAYDKINNNLFGIIIEDENLATLYHINLDTAETKNIGSFPLSMDKKLLKRHEKFSDCYDYLGMGGAIMDSASQYIIVYYSTYNPDGLYFEVINFTAVVKNYGLLPYNIPNPVFDPTYQYLYSLLLGEGPDYKKYFASVNVNDGDFFKSDELAPYDGFYGNEAAFIVDKSLYTCIMFTTNSSSLYLISVDIKTGKIVYQPSYFPAFTIWGMEYADF